MRKMRLTGLAEKFSLLSILAMLCIVSPAIGADAFGVAQPATVTGTVVDESNAPLLGVYVSESGTNNSTVTDINGAFSLRLTGANPVLEVSYMGYETQNIAVGGQTRFNISMKSAVGIMDEVVVVGYGAQKRATITGSVAQATGEDLAKVGTVNITNTLAGKTAGVIGNTRSGEPGDDDATILIRGINTTGSRTPLIVVDGVADRNYARLNPDDIESISILKDGAAAIYGARAANGVILVTTKRGSNQEGRVRFNYNGSYTLSQPTRVADLLNGYEFAKFIQEYELQARNGFSPKFGATLEEILRESSSLTYGLRELETILAGDDPIRYADVDWWGASAKKWAQRTQHSISMSGGTDKLNFYTSAQYMWQDAIYKHSVQNYSQYQFTQKIDARLTNAIRFSLDILGRQAINTTSRQGTEGIWRFLQTTTPLEGPYYPNGLLRRGGDGLGNNPVAFVSDIAGYNESKNNTLNLKPFLRVDLGAVTQGLYTEGYAALDYTFNYSKGLGRPYSIYEYDPDTDEYVDLYDQMGQISVSRGFTNTSRITMNAKLGYQRTFNEVHNVDVFVAYEQQKYNSDQNSMSRGNYLSDVLPEINFGSDEKIDWNTSGSGNTTARQNYFGRAMYNYKGKYLFELTVRHDGSMNFPKSGRWGTFPGVSLGWVLSEEGFFEPIKSKVNYLKLRASFASMGNDNVSAYQYLATYQYVPTNSDAAAARGMLFGDAIRKIMIENTTPNPYITWEKQDTWNFGVNALALRSRLSLDVDYFYNKRKDILNTARGDTPNYSGLTLPSENNTVTQNQGFEFVLGWNDRAGDFTYGASANFTYVWNKLLKQPQAANIRPWKNPVGRPLNTTNTYQALGIFQTQEELNMSALLANQMVGDVKLRDIDGNGVINNDDTYISPLSDTPEIMYGLTLNGGWKGIDLNIFFQGQARARVMVQPSINFPKSFFNGRFIDPQYVYDEDPVRQAELQAAQVEKNLKAKWPIAWMRNTYYAPTAPASTHWLRNAAFVRLKSVELGYTFPKSILAKVGIERMRAYINGNNLFTIDKIKDYDPESTPVGGFGMNRYPLSRNITLGLNLTF